MQHEVKIPSLGESILSGIITQWNFNSGDFVKEGDIIYELETDKITSEGTAEVSGVIKILAEVDSEVEIGQWVATIDDTATSDESEVATTPTPTLTKTIEVVPTATSTADDKYPPSVKRIATQSGVDPSTVKGTGKEGRVTKGDMLAAVPADNGQQRVAPPELSPQTQVSLEPPTATTDSLLQLPAPAPAVDTVEKKRVSRKRMTPIRAKIAQRLVSVKNEAAILTTFNEVDMSAVMHLRKEMQEEFVATHGVKLGFMSFFIKATVNALKAVPSINAQIEGNEIVTNHFYDIGVAVGTERGLVVPVVRDCDRLTFSEIEQQLVDYAKLASQGKLSIEAMQGGVFTISNGGVYGSLLSTPIINPPQSGILGMHTIQQRPIAVNGQVEIRPMMYLALSYDHRIVDGKEAVTFLIAIKKALESPSRLLFGI